MDIMTGEKLSSIAISLVISWSVRLSSRRGGEWGDRYFGPLQVSHYLST